MPAEPTYPQARYWLLTIPHAEFVPYLPPGTTYIKGQLELGLGVNQPQPPQHDTHVHERVGGNGGYLHWQVVVAFRKKCRLRAVKNIFGTRTHAEPSRSEAASEYVWKEDTRIDGTQFELGTKPFQRGATNDWEQIRIAARAGQLDTIPGDVYCRLYGNLKRIAVDHCAPVAIEREVVVFWGRTGSGKSRTAWEQAGLDAYPKDPRSKFWDGYRDHQHVVIDEFRGDIDIAHLLRWFDRYPVIVEVKGSSVVLKAVKIWITSNLNPTDWYPTLDDMTKQALLRRLTITEMN